MSRTSTHTFTQTIVQDADSGAEVELRITYNFTPGAPEQGPTYSSGGQPADPDEIDFLSCKGPMDGDGYDKYRQDTYDTLAHSYLEGDIGRAQAIENALDELAGDADAAAEARADMQREDR